MATSVDQYLAALPAAQRAALGDLRALLLQSVPEAEEAIRTRVPVIRYRSKTVVGYGAGKGHLALYVMFGDALRVFAKDFRDFDVGRRVVRFAPDRPIPPALLGKLVRHRLGEIDAPRLPARGR